jgi:hypothetical protein
MKHAGQVASPRPGVSGVKAQISIKGLLEWAFQRECVSLDFSHAGRFGGEPMPSFGMEYVMIERARLGCRVDGGGSSPSHPDADVVAAALAALPEVWGGQRMAIQVAELARAGREPDWMPGATPRCEPVEWVCNRHGWHGKAEVIGHMQVLRRGRFVNEQVKVVPVRYTPTADQIGRARRGWLAWWNVLREMRTSFQLYGGLTCYEVTDAMPPMQPWRKNVLTKS